MLLSCLQFGRIFCFLDEESVQNFLNGLEDRSATKSDESKSVFVFVAKYATELWYRWDCDEGQWQWTPDWTNWMPCSETVVTGGQWDGETPAPENVAIICYLDAVRPVPSDEPYLPSADIVELVTKLHSLKNADINGSLSAVIKSINDTNTETSNEQVSSFIGALSSSC